MKVFFNASIIFLLLIGNLNTTAQDKQEKTNKKTIKARNWHHLDLKKDKIAGISTAKAYNELLKDKKLTRVIVAVIDGGVDIQHEDLKNKIWVNTGEIPGNGIDDDNNGYIDDIHGWNFLGNSNGENVDKERLELTRLYAKYSKKFMHSDTMELKGTDLNEILEYRNLKIKYHEKLNKARIEYENAMLFNLIDSIIKIVIGEKEYTLKDLKKIKTKKNKDLAILKKSMIRLFKYNYSYDELKSSVDYAKDVYLYQLNPLFNPRTIIGDDPEIITNTPYGNNNVTGPDAEHGTMVSGIIAAERNNNLGIMGIADSVKIMVLRAVPNGDEYDKDIANAITYAVNNGAHIINCSFGKNYSPDKKFVDDAIRLAQSKDVLIVHAAGNDADDNDSIKHYPTDLDNSGNVIMNNWIAVGASSLKPDKELPAEFSNYGNKTVDLFAPGKSIYSTKPGNKYGAADGTSFSSPIVAGTAALIKSVYPKLTAGQIKDIILKSSVKYSKVKVIQPSGDKSMSKSLVLFSDLSATGGIVNVYNALKLAGQY